MIEVRIPCIFLSWLRQALSLPSTCEKCKHHITCSLVWFVCAVLSEGRRRRLEEEGFLRFLCIVCEFTSTVRLRNLRKRARLTEGFKVLTGNFRVLPSLLLLAPPEHFSIRRCRQRISSLRRLEHVSAGLWINSVGSIFLL